MGYREEDIKILRDGDATRAAILENLETWLGEYKSRVSACSSTMSATAISPRTRTATRATASTRPWCPSTPLSNRGGRAGACQEHGPRRRARRGLRQAEGPPGHRGDRFLPFRHGHAVDPGAAAQPRRAARRSSRADPLDPRRPLRRRSRSSPAPRPDGAEPGVDLVTWTAVAPTQLALINEEAAPNYHGVFTAAFADGIEKGLADGNKNGVISNQELLDYVREQSEAYCKRNAAAARWA